MVGAAILALLVISSAFAAAVPAAAETCTGSVTGRVVLGYGDHGPAAGEWIQIRGMPGDPDGEKELVQTAADGSFRVDGVPAGWHNATARHAQFAFEVPGCGQSVDVGEVAYPLVHPSVSPIALGPSHPAAKALAAFLDAMLARDGPATLAWVTDDLRSRAPHSFIGVSNPCLYRYAVLSLVEWTTATPGQPPPGTVDARVRIYTHFWPGDVAGGPPRSYVQGVTLVDTARGWRVSGFTQIEQTRAEPNEPHGPHLSACDVGRRPGVWLASSGELPATGGIPLGGLILALAGGITLLAGGFALRRAAGAFRRRAVTRSTMRDGVGVAVRAARYSPPSGILTRRWGWARRDLDRTGPTVGRRLPRDRAP